MELDRFTMRPVRAYDGPRLHVMYGDPLVARWLRRRGESGPFAPTDSARHATVDAAHWTAHGFGRWLVIDGEAPVACGGPVLRTLSGHPELEIAWMVASDRWREGIATAIGRAALAQADELAIERPIAFTRVDNVASRGVMEKIGLQIDGEVEYAGYTHIVYRRPAAAGP